MIMYLFPEINDSALKQRIDQPDHVMLDQIHFFLSDFVCDNIQSFVHLHGIGADYLTSELLG